MRRQTVAVVLVGAVLVSLLLQFPEQCNAGAARFPALKRNIIRKVSYKGTLRLSFFDLQAFYLHCSKNPRRLRVLFVPMQEEDASSGDYAVAWHLA